MLMPEVRKIEVLMQLDERPVIESSASDRVFIDSKPETTYEVQRRLSRCGKATDVACILRDLRLNEHDAKRRLERRRTQSGAVTNGHGSAHSTRCACTCDPRLV